MAPALEWLKLNWPARHEVYTRMLDMFHEEGLDTSFVPQADNDPWVIPAKITAVKRCRSCSKPILPTRTYCSYMCKVVGERGGK